MKERLSDMFFNWAIKFQAFGDFELSNRALYSIMWRKQRWILLIIILSIPYFIWDIYAIHHGIRQFETETRTNRELNRSIMIIICGIAFIIFLFWEWIKTFKNRDTLFLAYPELNDELANLMEAEYVDEALQIYIYGHHLVIIYPFVGLKILDLDGCHSLEVSVGAMPDNPRSSVTDDWKIAYIIATFDAGEQVKILVPHLIIGDTFQRLEELQAYFYTYY